VQQHVKLIAKLDHSYRLLKVRAIHAWRERSQTKIIKRQNVQSVIEPSTTIKKVKALTAKRVRQDSTNQIKVLLLAKTTAMLDITLQQIKLNANCAHLDIFRTKMINQAVQLVKKARSQGNQHRPVLQHVKTVQSANTTHMKDTTENVTLANQQKTKVQSNVMAAIQESLFLKRKEILARKLNVMCVH
jgi:hypothetical protein